MDSFEEKNSNRLRAWALSLQDNFSSLELRDLLCQQLRFVCRYYELVQMDFNLLIFITAKLKGSGLWDHYSCCVLLQYHNTNLTTSTLKERDDVRKLHIGSPAHLLWPILKQVKRRVVGRSLWIHCSHNRETQRLL